jgi:hypothetical protein
MNFLLQRHFDAMDTKSLTIMSTILKTSFHSILETTHSNIRCLTVSISLQISHSNGLAIPLALRLSLVIILFWENNHKNTWILGGILSFHTGGR